MRSWRQVVVLIGALGAAVKAQTPAANEARAIFLQHVLPTLEQKCQLCHGPAKATSNLNLASRDGLLHGGSRGPAIVPGNAADSLLVTAIEQTGALKMPLGGKLSEAEIAGIRRWIDLGAPWFEKEAGAKSSLDDTWAFQPLKKSPGATGVDAFLKPRPRADRRTLIRRATLDLTGLPPSWREIDDFVRDPLPDQAAFAKVVERLLASPRYGERWGRHWLDVVRYADSAGYSNDFERPNAWRYRDYVIRSFQQDQPYDRFILEQIAGDELDPTDPENLIATGFLRMGPWEQTGMSVAAVTRQQWLDDVTHTTAASFLGVTMECARCHDHKFDPIPTKDYYRFQAVFAGTQFADRPALFLPGEKRADFEAGRARIQEQIRRAKAGIAGFDDLIRGRLPAGASPEDIAKAIKKKDLLSGDEFERMKVYNKRLELYARSIKRYDPQAYSVADGPSAQDVFILPVGNLQTPGEKVTPGVMSALYREGFPTVVSGRRLALAKWIADPRNPLTPRVMVNRIWQYHFGEGIVATPNDFGKLGKRPTHPELLDWLATYFIEHGWSVKQMHRVMMLSAAYQQRDFRPRRLEAEELRDSILAVAGELSLDTGGPGTFPEINADLAVQPQQIMGTLMPAYRPSPTRRERHRRTIYTFQQRNLPDPFLDVFNGPSLNESTARRDASNVPTQAFALFNSQFVHDMALALAARLGPGNAGDAFRAVFSREPTPEEARIAAQYLEKRTAFHRATPPPKKPERKPLVRSITSELTGAEVPIEEDQDSTPFEPNLHPADVSPETRALADLALVLFNSNEFIYVY